MRYSLMQYIEGKRGRFGSRKGEGSIYIILNYNKFREGQQGA
jgi:hypothetical protein